MESQNDCVTSGLSSGFWLLWGVLLLGLWDSQCESWGNWSLFVYLFIYGCLWPTLRHMGSPECGCGLYSGGTRALHGSWVSHELNLVSH